MSEQRYGLADFVGGDLSQRWRSRRNQITTFLQQVGLPPDQHSRCMYVFPKRTDNVRRTLAELETLVDIREHWAVITAKSGDPSKPIVIAFSTKSSIPNKAVMALYIEIHSRLISWWLINAWRSRQLSEATWALGDSMQTIPAVACARSLLETAAACWVDTRTFRDLWCKVKTSSTKSAPNVEDWYELNLQIWNMTWAGACSGRT